MLITDGLPLTVCIDCCILLNQCSEFFEKTNQAQTSLRQLLIHPKTEPQALETDINYIQKTVETFPKEEVVGQAIIECHLSNNYIHESDIPHNYFTEEAKNNNRQKYENKESQDIGKQKKYKVQMKKTSFKQNKKKLKRKSQSQKTNDSSLYINLDLEKDRS